MKKFSSRLQNRPSTKVIAALLATVFTPALVHAQAPASSALRDRVGPNAQTPQVPSFATPGSPIAPPSQSSASPLPANAQGLSLRLVSIDITTEPTHSPPARAKKDIVSKDPDTLQVRADKGQALDAEWVRQQFALNGFVGKDMSIGDVEALILAINRVFLANGYINSGVLPASDDWPAADGVLRLRLIHGRVVPGQAGQPQISVNWRSDSATVPAGKKSSACRPATSNRSDKCNGLTTAYVINRMPAAAATPLDGTALEVDFRRLSEDPAIRTVEAQLAPGKRPGDALLSLTVDPQPRYDAYFTIANSRSPSIGGERLAAGGAMRNAIRAGDVFAAETGITAGATDFTITYSAPLNRRMATHVRISQDQAGVVDPALRLLDIRSHDSDLEVGLSRSLIYRPLMPNAQTGKWISAHTLTVGATVLQRRSRTSLLGQPFSFSPGSVDGLSKYTVLRATADWLSRDTNHVLALSLTASFGLQGTGSDVAGIARPNPHFHTLSGQLNYAKRLGPRSLELRARLSAQAASGLLYSGERFSAGGSNTVRGYRENLLLTDEGIAGAVELSCTIRIGAGLCDSASSGWKVVQVGAFVDAASVRNVSAPQPLPRSISSVGTSLNWSPTSRWNLHLVIASPLKKVAQTGKMYLQDRGVVLEVTYHPLHTLF